MNMLIPSLRFARFLLVLFAATLLPLSVEAQAVLSINPGSLTAQAGVGANAPSQTVQIRNGGNGDRPSLARPAGAELHPDLDTPPR